MLSNSVVLVDDLAANHTYDLVSRQGMESIRREDGVASNLGSALLIKNTVDMNAPTAKNRHLVQLVWNEIDGTTGEIYPASVHAVITRHKMVADSAIISKLDELASFITSTTNMQDLLVGGN